MKRHFLIFCFLLPGFLYSQTKYQKDFLEFWNDINNSYAYLSEQKIDWQKIKLIYEPKATAIKTDREFVSFLESLLNELYNGHSSLNVNTKSSNRLVPSGQDVYVEKINNEFVITDLRKNFGAEISGLKIGQKIVKFNGLDVEPQLKKFFPTFTNVYNPAMYQYALDMLFAGTHDVKRKITVSDNGVLRTFFPDSVQIEQSSTLIETRILNKTTAYVRINNCLFNNELISAMDVFIDSVINFKNLIIDLTETPSGGNTTVARAIMGRFINSTMPYQKHEIDELKYETKRTWIEYVVPRKRMFKGNVYIIVGHWTGSMGEGIAIGFDGLKRAKIVGTKMAGLLGAIENFRLTETNIGYQFPTEKLFHINGTPREKFKPAILTKNTVETNNFIERIK